MRARTALSKQGRRNLFKGYAFISPWIVGFSLFTIYPVFASLYYSFTRYDIIRKPRWIGLENYVELMTRDELFMRVMGNTIYFVILGVPAGIIVAFLLAALLNNKLKFRPIFRTLFFLPTLVPAAASAEVWRWVFNSNWGVINSWIKSMGLPVIPFLSSPALAKPSLILIHCWGQGTAMVIFLAALQDVPQSLYDAARVDGANGWHQFWRVTVPMTTPAILFVLVTGLIGMFQYFAMGWLLTAGGPNYSTEFFSMYLYRKRIPVLQDGVCLGVSLDPLYHHCHIHASDVQVIGSLGVLWRRLMIDASQ